MRRECDIWFPPQTAPNISRPCNITVSNSLHLLFICKSGDYWTVFWTLPNLIPTPQPPCTSLQEEGGGHWLQIWPKCVETMIAERWGYNEMILVLIFLFFAPLVALHSTLVGESVGGSQFQTNVVLRLANSFLPIFLQDCDADFLPRLWDCFCSFLKTSW